MAKRLLVVGLVMPFALSCGAENESEPSSLHRYSLDTSQYLAPNVPPSLPVSNQNLALALDARSAVLTQAAPGSLERVDTRSFCVAGQLPTELPNWSYKPSAPVSPVHLTRASITLTSDGNDLVRTPTFAVLAGDATWSGCVGADATAKNATTATFSLAVDATNATALAIFPDSYARVLSIAYTTRD